jgi:hypothetical protein
MNTYTPIQYGFVGNLIKKFLHTKIGSYVGYISGISGFNSLEAKIVRAGGKIEKIRTSYNSRVDKGAALTASLLTGSALGSIVSPQAPLYIALSTSSLTPAKGDTTLSGETSVSGLARALATAGSYSAPASLDGSASYTLSKTFTAGASATIVSAGIFDASSTGNLFVEANLSSSATLASGDTLTITWTINL